MCSGEYEILTYIQASLANGGKPCPIKSVLDECNKGKYGDLRSDVNRLFLDHLHSEGMISWSGSKPDNCVTELSHMAYAAIEQYQAEEKALKIAKHTRTASLLAAVAAIASAIAAFANLFH